MLVGLFKARRYQSGATLIERDRTGLTCNEFNCVVPCMFYLVIRQISYKQGQ
jgi:hypothetical protein